MEPNQHVTHDVVRNGPLTCRVMVGELELSIGRRAVEDEDGGVRGFLITDASTRVKDYDEPERALGEDLGARPHRYQHMSVVTWRRRVAGDTGAFME